MIKATRRVRTWLPRARDLKKLLKYTLSAYLSTQWELFNILLHKLEKSILQSCLFFKSNGIKFTLNELNYLHIIKTLNIRAVKLHKFFF